MSQRGTRAVASVGVAGTATGAGSTNRPPTQDSSAALAAEGAFRGGRAMAVVDLGAGVRVFLALAVVRLLAFQCRTESGLHILLRGFWLGVGGCGFRCVRHGLRVARSGRPSRAG